ncbi:MAG: hypothetical protein O9322_04695 [Beijerinckiaceae bacterium]|nr:hypothetical protein [Beijerinckiaceae bacterium]MCZ8298818.1 hypothetical protein [Beijerinckiaceae bacterium]
MTMQFTQRFVLLLAATLFAGSAIAGSYAVRVPAGKRILVATFALYDTDTCTFGAIPEGKLVTPPQHGRVEILQERRVIDGGQCGRIEGWARNVYFTPSRGFRGTDTMRVDFQYNKWSDAPGLTSDSRSITLQVQ